MNDESMQAELERLKRENEQLKSAKQSSPKALSLKVSPKGGVSLYGLGRFPVTLYYEQWQKLLSFTNDISSFLKDNESQLKKKD